MKYLLLLFSLSLFSQNLFCQSIKVKIDTTFHLHKTDDDFTTQPYLYNTIFSIDTAGTDVEIRNEIFNKKFTLRSSLNTNGEIEFKNCNFSNADIEIPDINVIIRKSHFKNIRIIPYMDDRDQYNSFIYLDTIENEGNLEISDITISKGVRISGKIGGTLIISHVKSISDFGQIDLTGLHPYKKGGKIMLNLTDAPFSNIQLDYEDFEMDTSVTNYPKQACVTYTNLLNTFKTKGFTRNYQLLDIEFKHYKYTHAESWIGKIWGTFTDLIDHYWWNYGYNRELVLFWTIFFFLLFTWINKPIYHLLNLEVYTVNSLKDVKKSSFYYSLIYTSVIFFSFSLDIRKLKYGHKWYLAWFVFVFLIGVICLAYSINFVLKAGQPLS